MIQDTNPFGFQWHITDSCQGRCRHCYQSRFDDASEQPLDALKNIAAHIMSFFAGVPVGINLTGGEPFLYSGGVGGKADTRGDLVFELMEYLASFDNLEELNIITSTRGMDSVIVSRLQSLPKLTSVKVSLESHDPLINDGVRGAGHFDMASRGIRALSAAGLPVIVMASLGVYNYKSVGGLCRLASDLCARGVILERYVPLGAGAGLSNQVLTRREWADVIKSVCQVVEIFDDGVIEALSPYRAFRVDMPQGSLGEACGLSGAPCDLGPSSMALMPDGTVYPCRRCPTPVGKLPDDGMGGIMKALAEYASRPQRCYDFDF